MGRFEGLRGRFQSGGRKGMLLALIAVLLVPLVYSGVLLSSRSGPYDHLDNLPVAVVNKDKGAVSGNDSIHAGDDLVADLKKSSSLGWKFVSPEEASDGLKNEKYYMVIEIPEDFSEKVTTVLGDNPEVPELRYIQNEGLSFTAAQITKGAAEKIKEQLGDKITENYTSKLFAQLGDVADGFKSGADGSSQIFTGTGDLQKGTGQILASLTGKSADIAKLADGSKKLEAGSKEMLNSLSAKQGNISALAAGTKQVKDGTGTLLQSLTGKSGDIEKLAAGSKQVKDGTGLLYQSLKQGTGKIDLLAGGAGSAAKGAADLDKGAAQVLEGLKQSEAGSAKLKEGLAVLAPGSSAAAKGMSDLDAGAAQVNMGAKGLAQGLEAYLAKNPQLKTDREFLTLLQTSKIVAGGTESISKNTQLLKAGTAQVAGGVQQASEGANALADGMAKLKDGQSQVSGGAAKLAAGTKAIADGNQTLSASWKELTSSVAKLNAGASKVSDGNQSVNSGWKEMQSGVSVLYSGTQKIYSGNTEVDAGWKTLTAGAGDLHTGLVQVSGGNETVKNGWSKLTDGVTQLDAGVIKLKDGSGQLAAGLASGAEQTGGIHAGDQNISMFSSPVKLSAEKVNSYEFYRDSTAPYILSLALFVGILLLTFVTDFRKPAEASGIGWYAGKLGELSLFAVLQALVLSIFTLVILQLQVENAFYFVLFTIFTSLVFMFIVFALTSLAGNIGRFLAFVLAVAQITTTGASLPVILLPEGVQALSAWLPFTYSIAGFKAVISLGNTSVLWGNALVLLAFAAVFALLSAGSIFTPGRSRDENMELEA
ncbi:YhgE/Pip domain-containing protein [Bacillus sp. FJAT-42376]|uniref:YhgE/Pip family protein n=1 Tax=Bacillus sp. FJAT-42376 TaxID=2014076 RepID=UPI0013DE3626|nr:YhgE/Pip domain-containing protein [Bacillus sp. FJAT-42376]